MTHYYFIFNNFFIVIVVIFLILLIFIILYNKNSIIEYFRFLFNIFINRQQPINTTHLPTTLTKETFEIMESIEEIEQEYSGEGDKIQSKKMLKSMNLLKRSWEAF